MAEYPVNGAAASPQKEYGYRNGQLLIAADAVPVTLTNVALPSNGGTVTASSTMVNPPLTYPVSSVNNGDRKGLNAGSGGSWLSSTATVPQWVQVDFNSSKNVSEIDVFSLQDNYGSPIEPTETTTFSLYGLTTFDVQYWNGTSWTTVPGGSVSGNNKVWKKVSFAPLSTSKIRVLINGTVDGWSRMVEVEAWAAVPSANVALSASGATVSASSTMVNPPFSYPVSATNNGDRKGLNAGTGGNWLSSSATFPQWVQVDFNGSKTIGEIDVFSLQDNYGSPIEPIETTTFNLYGLTAFDLQYWNGSSWTTVPGGSVSGNNKVWKKVTFAPLTTSKIRVLINGSVDGYSRVVELEAWTPGAANINWLVTDHLGTPRMIIDQSGTLGNIKRHDYLPFGEELFAPGGGRSAALGYTNGDGIRQQFTQKERDSETQLDYFCARYFGSTQGRFTSTDQGPFTPIDPQSLNRYNYAQNNPLKFIDPSGKTLTIKGKDADYLVSELERVTGYKLIRNKKTGVVTIAPKSSRNEKGTSKHLAEKLSQVVGDKDINVGLVAASGAAAKGIYFDDYITKTLDVDDYKVAKRDAPDFAAASLGHVIEEYYKMKKQYSRLPDPYNAAHKDALKFEGEVMSDFTHQSEGTASQAPTTTATVTSFVYRTVTYDVIVKSDVGEGSNVFVKVVGRKNKTEEGPK